MRAILIDPRSRSITEIDIANDYKAMQNALKYDLNERLVFQEIVVDEGEGLYVDEEGLMKIGLSKFNIDQFSIAGKGLICGYDKEGETVDTKMTVEQVKELIVWSDDVTDGYVPPAQIFAW